MKAVFFDMDGVLIDSEEQWKAVEGAFFGRMVPGWQEQDHHKIVGLGVPDLYKFLVKEYGVTDPYEDFARECEALAGTVYGERVNLYPGFLELLAALRDAGLPVSLVTASPRRWVDMVLRRFALEPQFHSVTTIDDVDGEGKPSPAIYLKAARTAGVAPEHGVAIEDSIYGVASAKAAGMKVVAFRNGSNTVQDLSEAHDEAAGHAEITLERLKALFS